MMLHHLDPDLNLLSPNIQVTADKPTRGAPWHPGPRGHALRGRILAYNYLRMLEDAIADAYFAMEEDEKDGSKLVDDLLKPEHHEVPEAVACHPEICTHPAQCAMSVEPRAEGYLLDLVESPEISREQSLERQPNDKWHIQLIESDIEAVMHSKGANLGYLDLKYVIQGNKEAGPITFAIETKQKGYIFVCEPPGLWGKLPENCGELALESELIVDGELVPWAVDKFYADRTVASPTCFTSSIMFEHGKHKVEVTPINADGKYIALQALVWW